MTVTLAGIGCGTADTVTAEVLEALEQADYLIGARRLLEGLPVACGVRRETAVAAREILEKLTSAECARPCVVLSGDTGFYSGARALLPLLKEAELEVRVLPGVSSVQVFAARLGRPWQDWRLCSAHGVDCDAVAEVCRGRAVCFLTGGTLSAAALCRQLTEAGLGDLSVAVGENLSYDEEKVTCGTASELAEGNFAPLSVLLAEAAPRYPRRAPGIPDEAFLRDKVPMTKQEVRAAALAKLAVEPGDVCWDIGAGTGSVSVELALQAKAVWAVERKPEALALALANRQRFGAWNLRLVEGTAPAALVGWPTPDAVFVGGSGGGLREILTAVHDANPRARVCVSAIALETLRTASDALAGLGYAVSVTQLAVSRAREAGGLHLLTAQNPVFLITGAAP